jgi:hypothetical protein
LRYRWFDVAVQKITTASGILHAGFSHGSPIQIPCSRFPEPTGRIRHLGSEDREGTRMPRPVLQDLDASLEPVAFAVGRVDALASVPKKGDYFVYELSCPDQVSSLLRNLETKGVQILEMKEMGNPLEERFTES